MSNEHGFLRIANKQTSKNIAAREIGAHIEFARVSGRRDRFRSSKEFEFIAKLRLTAPADKPCRARCLVFMFEFNRLDLQQKCGESVGRDFRLASDKSSCFDKPGPLAQLSGKPQTCRVSDPQAMQKKESAGDERIFRS